MNAQPHDGTAGDVLCGSTLRMNDNLKGPENVWQMLSSFNHRCRNSLNGIKMSLYLFKREMDGPVPGQWQELERAYQEIELLFDRLQMLYRPLSLTVVRSPIGRLIDERLPTWRSWFGARGRTLEFTRPSVDLPCDFDPMHLGLGLDAFVRSRAESGRGPWKTQLTWGISEGLFEIRWEEQIAPKGCDERAHESGRPGGAASCGKSDALAHPLLKRIVAAHGGFVETTTNPAFVVKVRWPRFQSPESSRVPDAEPCRP
jgi:hypothetical protein